MLLTQDVPIMLSVDGVTAGRMMPWELIPYSGESKSLVSGLNHNKFNWLQECSDSELYVVHESASFTGSFSKSVIDKICSNV